MDTLIQDIKYGARMLLRRPGLTIAVVLSLAIGIGANTTLYVWMKAVVFDPLAGTAESREFVIVGTTNRPGIRGNISYSNFQDYRAASREVFADMLVFNDGVEMALGATTESEQPERLWGNLVSGNYFDVLGVRPALGRTFIPEEDVTPGTHPVAVLSYNLWKGRFAGDVNIVGREVTLNGHPFTIVGVAPESFLGTELALRTELWVPLMMERQILGPILENGTLLNRRDIHWLLSLARLKPGITRAQAQAAMDVIAEQLAEAYPDANRNRTAFVNAVSDAHWGAQVILRRVLFILSAVVALALLIACANVANLLLVRALDRRRETAMRMSLGASRGRILRQHVTESLLLALLAGLCAVVIASWATGLLIAFLPPIEAPIQFALGLDRSTIIFTFAMSTLAGLAFGLVTAFHCPVANLLQTLKEGAATATTAVAKSGLRKLLVIAQVAVCLVLLVAAGLFVRSLQRAGKLDPGFDERNVLLAEYDLKMVGSSQDRGFLFHREIIEKVRALPGVRAATFATAIPLEWESASTSAVFVEGYQPAPDERVAFQYNIVGPDYFETMQIAVLEGRGITLNDNQEAQGVVVVNETAARRYWLGRQVVGSRIRRGNDWLQVVGVVKDGKYRTLSEEPQPYMYLSGLQTYISAITLHIAALGDPLDLSAAVRNEVRSLNSNLPLFEIKTLEQHLQFPTFVVRFAGTLLLIIGTLALLLACVGLYGLIAHAARQRTREVGIRLAFGAQRADIIRMILRGGLTLTLVGIACGLALAFATTRFLSSQLIEVSATDPLIFLTVPVLLVLIATFASYIPARRAARTDPAIALKHE